MPATSIAQRKFMGMVHAVQKGMKAPSAAVAKATASMKPSSVMHFATTKEKGLPKHVVLNSLKKRLKKK